MGTVDGATKKDKVNQTKKTTHVKTGQLYEKKISYFSHILYLNTDTIYILFESMYYTNLRLKIIPSIFPKYNGKKPEINSRRKTGKSASMWKLTHS